MTMLISIHVMQRFLLLVLFTIFASTGIGAGIEVAYYGSCALIVVHIL